MTNKEVVDELRSLREDIQDIQKTLNELTGAKKFLMWVTGIVATISALLISYLSFRKK